MKKKVSFWISPKGNRTFRVHLRDGERKTFHGWWYTDEGYDSFESTFIRRGDEILRYEESEGRDCDALHRHSQELYCPISQLGAHRPFPEQPRLRFPKWKETKYRRYNSAEVAAGY